MVQRTIPQFLSLFSIYSHYVFLTIEEIENILNNKCTKTSELRGLKPGSDIYILYESTVTANSRSVGERLSTL